MVSTTVPTPVLVPRLAPDAFERLKSKVRLGFAVESAIIGTSIVWVVTPGLKASVPETDW
jgi:hypothetical protein